MTAHGTYTTVDDRPAVRFERRLPHPVAAVWHAVTEPGELAHWFPCAVELGELRPGAPLRFDFGEGFTLDGEVLELDPPRLLAFSWGEDRVRIELAPDGAATRLTFLHVLHTEGADAAAKTMAGWHVCLDALEQAVAGTPAEPSPGGPTPDWQRRYDEYVAAGVPSGAAIPGA